MNLHGFTEEDGLIILNTKPGEHVLRTEDIVETIQQHGESIAVIFLAGVHYYTGNMITSSVNSNIRAGCDSRSKVRHRNNHEEWTRSWLSRRLGFGSRCWKRPIKSPRLERRFRLLVLL